MKFLESMLTMRDSVFGQIFVLSVLAYGGYRWAGRVRWLQIAGNILWLGLFALSIVNLFTDGND
jgi:hypothetical protein